MTDRYLLDTVTLSRMTPAQRSGDFVSAYGRVPTPVIYEARGLSDPSALTAIEYPTTANVLRQVSVVVRSLAERDLMLDLYQNQGNGDVFLLACALVEADLSRDQLFSDRWIIATDDKLLTAKASELGVVTCTSAHFIAQVP